MEELLEQLRQVVLTVEAADAGVLRARRQFNAARQTGDTHLESRALAVLDTVERIADHLRGEAFQLIVELRAAGRLRWDGIDTRGSR